LGNDSLLQLSNNENVHFELLIWIDASKLTLIIALLIQDAQVESFIPINPEEAIKISGRGFNACF
jgi:hypothetical protein